MIIIGSGNLGKHIIDQLIQDNYQGAVFLFDEHVKDDFIYNKYPVIHSWDAFDELMTHPNESFFIAIGHPRKREKMYLKIKNGKYSSLISKHAGIISTYSTIGEGTLVQPGCCISHHVQIGKSNILHANTLIGHDVITADFVTIGSNVNILKGVEIGKHTVIGPNCLIMDNVKIGENVFIEPGVVVKNNVADNMAIEFPF